MVQHMPRHLHQQHVQIAMYAHLVTFKHLIAQQLAIDSVQVVMYAPLVTFKHRPVPQPATGSVNNVKRVQPINTRQDVLEPVITHAIHAHHV